MFLAGVPCSVPRAKPGKMKFTIVDFQEVRRDLDSGPPSTNFNTNFHTEAEAPNLPTPLDSPYSFDRWLPLILQSRGLDASDLQVISLSRKLVSVLVHASAASVHTRVLNRAYAEDLQDEVASALVSLEFPPEGLIMRLGACSPKDGAQTTPGHLALHSVDDILLLLTTSLRAFNCFTDMLNGSAQEERLFFLPFDSRMAPEREYRVFCAPRSLSITAVSQYRWHKPWVLVNHDRSDMESHCQRILGGIREIHARILENLGEPSVSELDDLLRIQGLTFDVLHDQEADMCVLVELNPFGVRSACGSCLFQWLRDREVLYGELTGDIEFRVTI